MEGIRVSLLRGLLSVRRSFGDEDRKSVEVFFWRGVF